MHTVRRETRHGKNLQRKEFESGENYFIFEIVLDSIIE